jgi:hypothetical protein
MHDGNLPLTEDELDVPVEQEDEQFRQVTEKMDELAVIADEVAEKNGMDHSTAVSLEHIRENFFGDRCTLNSFTKQLSPTNMKATMVSIEEANQWLLGAAVAAAAAMMFAVIRWIYKWFKRGSDSDVTDLISGEGSAAMKEGLQAERDLDKELNGSTVAIDADVTLTVSGHGGHETSISTKGKAARQIHAEMKKASEQKFVEGSKEQYSVLVEDLLHGGQYGKVAEALVAELPNRIADLQKILTNFKEEARTILTASTAPVAVSKLTIKSTALEHAAKTLSLPGTTSVEAVKALSDKVAAAGKDRGVRKVMRADDVEHINFAQCKYLLLDETLGEKINAMESDIKGFEATAKSIDAKDKERHAAMVTAVNQLRAEFTVTASIFQIIMRCNIAVIGYTKFVLQFQHEQRDLSLKLLHLLEKSVQDEGEKGKFTGMIDRFKGLFKKKSD